MTNQINDVHRTRLRHVEGEARNLAGAMTQIADATSQVLDQGGTLQVQSQLSFATGAMARILKDFGVVEQLQSDGAAQIRKMRVG